MTLFVGGLVVGSILGFVGSLAGLHHLRPDLYEEFRRYVFDDRHDQ